MKPKILIVSFAIILLLAFLFSFVLPVLISSKEYFWVGIGLVILILFTLTGMVNAIIYNMRKQEDEKNSFIGSNTTDDGMFKSPSGKRGGESVSPRGRKGS